MVLHFGVSGGNFGIYGYGVRNLCRATNLCIQCIMVLNCGVYGVLCMNMNGVL